MHPATHAQAKSSTKPAEQKVSCANENGALYDEFEMRYESGFAQWLADELNRSALKKVI